VNGRIISSVASERSEARISAMKKQVISAFTTTAMLDYEHHIDRNINFIMKRFTRDDTRNNFNIATWNIFFAFDTICQIAFSDNQGLMEKEADISNTLSGARQRFAHWHTWQSLPWLERLLYKNSWTTRKPAKTSILGQLASQRLKERMEKGGLGTHSDLLDRYLQGSKRDPVTITTPTVVGMILSTIHAGAETTSATINITLYYLLQNPKTFAKLKQEISSANLSSPPKWTEVVHLKYLEACIKEAGRLHPLFVDPMEREVPAEGMSICDVWIPGGTTVAVNTHALNRQAEVFGDNPDEYIPERWIDADEPTLAKMERSNVFFGGGRRVCIGQHVAWIEMKKYIPELITKFDVSLDPSLLMLSLNPWTRS
jgi:cytochrome P450